MYLLFQEDFWTDPNRSIIKAYETTDQAILSHSADLGRGGSTAVTAILLNNQKLWIANVGDSRAVMSRGGSAIQMSIDHEPNSERDSIEDRGGFVSNLPGSLINFVIYHLPLKCLMQDLYFHILRSLSTFVFGKSMSDVRLGFKHFQLKRLICIY